jgi:hypothetical protein
VQYSIAIVFLQYFYVLTKAPISFTILSPPSAFLKECFSGFLPGTSLWPIGVLGVWLGLLLERWNRHGEVSL